VIAPRLALLAVSGAVVAAGVAGCAQQSTTEDKKFTGDANRVANTVRALDDAYTDEQNDDPGAERVCRDLLSARLVTALGGANGCPTTVAKALKNADATEMDVRDVTFNPERTVATVPVRLKMTDDEQRLDTLKLVLQGRSWKFDGSVTGRKGEKAAPALPADAAPATTTTAAPTPAQ
jgi:hypothetical protein